MKLTGAPLPTSNTQKAASKRGHHRDHRHRAQQSVLHLVRRGNERARKRRDRDQLRFGKRAAEAVEARERGRGSRPADAKPLARNRTQPASTNSMVIAQPASAGSGRPKLLPAAADDQPDAVPQAPRHVGPPCPVPQPAQAHRDERREHVARGAVAAAAERNVEVVAQEVRQRDVPAAPEVAQVGREIRPAEILRQQQAEQQRGADRHFGIGGEIEKKLERERERRGPGFAEVEHALRALARTADRPRARAGRRAAPSWRSRP